ncbi:MAG: ABC transporter permease [Phycisphaerales bacterium]
MSGAIPQERTGRISATADGDRSRRRVRPKAGRAVRFGAVLLAVVIGGCLVAIPWSFGRVEDASGVGGPRYAVGNLELNLLPPSWLGAADADEHADVLARLEAARSADLYVPGRVLGTDRLGRDVFARLLAGGVVSLAVGFFAAAVAVLLGTLYGAASAFAGGRTDAVLMRIVDVLFGLPSILLVVLLAVAVDGAVSRAGWDLGPAARQWIGLATLFVAIGGVGWLTLARIVRGQVLSLRTRPFMEACEALGVPRRRRFVRHVLPNLAGPVLVYAALAVPAAMLAESFLSFLGIGVQEPLPSWGNLASEGLQELNPFRSRWWLLAAPCVALSATLLALNLVGDHIRRGFDPGSGTP